MPNCAELFKDPGFYFKIIELILCVIGTVIYAGFLDSYYIPDRSTILAIAVAVPNCIITCAVLILMYIFEAQHQIMELCLNGAGGALNIAIGVLLLCYIDNNKSVYYLILAITCLACGILMIIDCVRLLKKK